MSTVIDAISTLKPGAAKEELQNAYQALTDIASGAENAQIMAETAAQLIRQRVTSHDGQNLTKPNTQDSDSDTVEQPPEIVMVRLSEPHTQAIETINGIRLVIGGLIDIAKGEYESLEGSCELDTDDPANEAHTVLQELMSELENSNASLSNAPKHIRFTGLMEAGEEVANKIPADDLTTFGVKAFLKRVSSGNGENLNAIANIASDKARQLRINEREADPITFDGVYQIMPTASYANVHDALTKVLTQLEGITEPPDSITDRWEHGRLWTYHAMAQEATSLVQALWQRRLYE